METHLLVRWCEKRKADSTLRSSRAVPHPSTNRALRRLTSEVRRNPVHSTRYGRQRMEFLATAMTPNTSMRSLITRQHGKITEDGPGHAALMTPCLQKMLASLDGRHLSPSQTYSKMGDASGRAQSLAHGMPGTLWFLQMLPAGHLRRRRPIRPSFPLKEILAVGAAQGFSFFLF